MTAKHAEMSVRRQTAQDELEGQASQISLAESEAKRLQIDNKKLQEANTKLLDLTEEHSTMDNLKELHETQKQLKETLKRKTAEQTNSKETIDKQCREIGEARRARDVSETDAAERIAQLETVLKRKEKDVGEARYQSPPSSE